MVGSMEPRTSEQQSRLTVDMQVEVIGISKVVGLMDYHRRLADESALEIGWGLAGTVSYR